MEQVARHSGKQPPIRNPQHQNGARLPLNCPDNRTNMTHATSTSPQSERMGSPEDTDPTPNAVKLSRRVSNLTVEQVEKKRAIDRENQRHCRAKNKAYVRTLEAKIEDLTRRLEESEAQLRQFQRRESSSVQSATNNRTVCLDSIQWNQEAEEVPGPPGNQSLPHSLNMEKRLDALPLDLGIGITVNAFNPAEDFSLIDFALSDMAGTGFSWDLIPNFDPDTGGIQFGNPVLDSALLSIGELPGSQNDQLPEWKMLPLNIAPTTALDEFILNTTATWRARASQAGHQHAELNEPAFPSIASLLNHSGRIDQNVSSDNHCPLSTVVAAHVFRSPVHPLPERVAFLYHLCHHIRWLVCGTKESYESIPPAMKPTQLQRTVPHPAWIDTVSWPAVRDELIRRVDVWTRFMDFRRVTGQSLSVNWPYTDSGAFLESADRKLLTLNPIFEAHIRKPENWTVSKEAADEFAFLAPYTLKRGSSTTVIGAYALR